MKSDTGGSRVLGRIAGTCLALGVVAGALNAADRNADRTDRFTSDRPYTAPADPVELTVAEVWPPIKLPARIEEMDQEAVDYLSAVIKPDQGEIFDDLRAGRYSVLVHLDPAQDQLAPGFGVSAVRNGVRQFAATRQGKIRYEYGDMLPHVINVRGLSDADINDLRALPGVTRVEEDKIYEIDLHLSIPLIRGLESQKAAAGHSSATGAGVRVCVIDTGINASHVFFAGKIDAAADYDHYNNDTNPNDDNGHGSNVAGIAAGLDGYSVNLGCGSLPIQGVAPDATIIAMKVCSAGGSCPTSDIVAGINDCASTGLPGGQADVINMSLGGGQFSGTCDTESSAAAANNAVAAGVTVIAAAGNNGYANALGSPACGSQVIAVGAVYDFDYPNCEDTTSSFTWCLNAQCTSTCTDSAPVDQDERICFSNRSVNLDVSAPGGGIWSAGISSSTSIIEMYGTSQASPHVAGLAALLIGEDPSLTPAEVRQLLRDATVDLGTAGFDVNFGYGRIDVIDALDLVGGGGGCTTNPECDDGLWCNGPETCVGGTCQAGTPPNCDDSVACTADACNESTDSCTHTPNNAACDDGLFCNGAETCHVTLGCQSGTDPCGGEPCNEATDTCGGGGGGAVVWMSFTANVSVPGVGTAANEDIVEYDPGSGTWSMIFDGSDVGLSGFALGGHALLPNGNLLLTFTAAGTVGGVAMDDSDVVQFTPTSLGSTTAGSFSMYFDGSDVGLTTSAENLDTVGLDASGRLVVSTTGNFSGNGASGLDEDLFVFNATSLGTNTTGSFQLYFDGSDVGLNNSSNEDVDAAGLTSSGNILLSTLGNFSVSGVSGADEDIFEFTPTSLGSTTAGSFQMFLDLSTLGIATSADVASVELIE